MPPTAPGTEPARRSPWRPRPHSGLRVGPGALPRTRESDATHDSCSSNPRLPPSFHAEAPWFRITPRERAPHLHRGLPPQRDLAAARSVAITLALVHSARVGGG